MPIEPYYSEGGIVIYHGRAEDVLPGLSGVHLVAADLPYNGVIDEAWDNQWSSDAEFLAWADNLHALLNTCTTDNATIYTFSGTRLAARMEVQIEQRFNVINSAVWDKGDGRKGAAGSGIDVTALRAYWPASTERIIVAEKRLNGAFIAADDKARADCGYWDKCQGVKVSVFGDYMRAEFQRAGVTQKQVAALFPSKTGGMTGCVSNWLLGLNIPTAPQYAAIRDFLGGGDYLRREYEDLRREYEDLRRPFFLTADDQWGDVWRFSIERDRFHPCQKPLPMMQQIVRVSSRHGDLVLDPTMGSGSTLRAAKDLGRRAIGIDIIEANCEIAAKRLAQGVLPFGGGR